MNRRNDASGLGNQDREKETHDAIKAWHRGESLTKEQRDLVDEAARNTAARAYGVDI